MNGSFVIRQNQNGSELLHYGVKGMKWGVRNEKETSGSRSSSGTTQSPKVVSRKEFEKGAGLSSTPKQGQKTSKAKQANSMAENAKDALSKDKAFGEWLKKNGKYDDFLNNLNTYYSWRSGGPIQFYLNKDAALKGAEDAYNMFVEYDQDPTAHMTDAERENQQNAIKMREELQKALANANVEVHPKQAVYMDWDENSFRMIYHDGFGNQYSVEKDQIATLVKRIDADAAKLRDVHNSVTREKNVTGKASADKMKKRERTDSDKENDKNGKVGIKDTYLSDKSTVRKTIRKIRINESLKRASETNAESMINKLTDMKKSGKTASQSKSVKTTMKQKISSVGNTIKNGVKAVSNFLKNPLNIQNNTTSTSWTISERKK